MEPGRGDQLGARIAPGGVNFALFSAHASRVELVLVDRDGHETRRVDLPERSGDIWHGFLPGIVSGQAYHYRVHGPSGPGHHFDPSIPLLDPYALAWTKGLADRGRPDAVVIALPEPYLGKRPNTPFCETIIYEAHVKGLTRQHPGLRTARPGTYGALADPVLIEHLLKLGITAIELLPLQAFADEPFLAKKGLSNYWGYNPIGFFTPEPRYAASLDPIHEFRQAVAALHAAGIEVILDVVYNHSGEGDLTGRTLSFRGIDNASYYKLDDAGQYLNDTGCGNVLDLGHPAVIRLAMDSLRYWVEVMGVDGFRFDLATTLGRDGRDFEAGAAFLDCLRQDPVLSRVKLIAEPWDIGPNGYQLGGFGHPFAEWNDRFRDTVRRFWCLGDPVLPDLAQSLLGSATIFDHAGRRSWASVNFITSHDGFTAADLVSFEVKRNDANLENNQDGHNHNFSNHHGIEGATDDPTIRAARRQTVRNMLATMLLAQGTPMLLAGDELGNGQEGNNNAYCQDNPIGWLDWPQADDDLSDFIGQLCRLRRAHPCLRQSGFLHGEDTGIEGMPNVAWKRADGQAMMVDDWQSESRLSVRVDLATADEALALLINGQRSAEIFHIEPQAILLVTGRVETLAETLVLAPHALAVVQLR